MKKHCKKREPTSFNSDYMENYGDDIVLRVLDEDNSDRIEPLNVGDIAHRQIGIRLGISSKYYGKMLSEHPDLLVTNVNVAIAICNCKFF